MSRRQILISIECGENTCASEPGSCCQYLATQRFGTISYCSLFSVYASNFGGSQLKFLSLEDKDGWLQRHPRCMEFESQKEIG